MNNETKKSVKKNPFKFIIALVILLAAAIGLSYFTYTYYQSYQRESIKDKYYNALPDETDALFTISDSEELMFDTEAYKSFETACLGNTNNDLIAAGYYAQKGSIVCQSEDKTIASVDDKEIVVSDHPSSYINIIHSNIFYRDNTDRKVYRYSLDNKKVECVIDANCGETVATVRGVYFIDYATKKLNYLAFSGSESKQMYDERIDSFAVVGNILLVLQGDKKLGLLKLDGTFTLIDSDVDSFFYDGYLYIQKGSNIYRISSFSNSKTIIDDIAGILIYENKGYLYISDDEKITKISINGDEEPHDIYTIKENEIIRTIIDTGNANKVIVFTETDDILYEKTFSLTKDN